MIKHIKDYPRPQFERENWTNLNGEWNFAFDDENIGEKQKYFNNFPNALKINVPFTYETKLSGIGDQRGHNNIWYNRTVTLSETDLKGRLLLHFEGSDYYTKIWVNGQFVGENKGGYHRFTFDIAPYAVEGENNITVKVWDSFSCELPRGKQRYRSESFSCWYVQTTGIWKTVWLEKVSENYFKMVKNTPVYDNGTVDLVYEVDMDWDYWVKYDFCAEAVISFDGEILNTNKLKMWNIHSEVNVPICGENVQHNIKYWSPEEPNLYDIEYRLYRNGELVDTVKSYFGVRKISIEDDKIFLNEKPLYLKMVLDQGYWAESHLTPPSEEALIDDIDYAVKYGFNGVRKHQKIEDERFLYWCDVRGILVWSEMASFYFFSDRSVQRFTDEWVKIVRQNYNHPSIITWVPLNESWGVPDIRNSKLQQGFANSIYYLTKSMDNTRLVISNDGWEHTISDIITLHDYCQHGDELLASHTDDELKILNNLVKYTPCDKYMFADGYKYNGQPIIMSEYGGIAIKTENGWGYGEMASGEPEFMSRFKDIMSAIASIPYLSGYCYTQLTDVQQEMNGLLYENREDKLSQESIDSIKEINHKMYNK